MALPGAAVGAGLAIALACDIRIAAQSAFLSGGYSKIGLSGDYGIAWLLTRTVGTSLAREMMFTSDRIDAARADKLGLVNRVVPDAELAGVSRALAQQIADGPADAIRMMKQNLNEVASLDYFSAIDREAERIVELSASENHKEAVRAFVEKRKPVFNKA
jgi:enoyl-CoA hydratase/carnithine racemase